MNLCAQRARAQRKLFKSRKSPASGAVSNLTDTAYFSNTPRLVRRRVN